MKHSTPELADYIINHYDGSTEVIDEIQSIFKVPRYIIHEQAIKLGVARKKKPCGQAMKYRT